MSSRGVRSHDIVQDTLQNRVKVEWPFNKNNELGPCPQKDTILENVRNITSKDLKKFREDVNGLVIQTMETTSPMILRWGGWVVAVFVMIIGVVCLGVEEFAVGTVVLILGFLFAGLALWYRNQLIQRAWKKIGQGLVTLFKDLASRIPGVSCEFHVKGTHKLNRKDRRKKSKKKKGSQAERNMFSERYIVLYLPGDASHFHQYSNDKRSVTQILKADSAAVKERHDYLDDEPLILPYWWSMKTDTKTGKPYFINNLKHETTWNAPTAEQIEMEREELEEILAPPRSDSESESESD